MTTDDNTPWPTAPIINARITIGGKQWSRPCYFRRNKSGAYEAFDVWGTHEPGTATFTDVIEYWPADQTPPRVWQIGDLVDSTEGLPDGAIVVDAENDPWRWNTQPFVGRGGYSDVYDLVNPRLIWLPNNNDQEGEK